MSFLRRRLIHPDHVAVRRSHARHRAVRLVLNLPVQSSSQRQRRVHARLHVVHLEVQYRRVPRLQLRFVLGALQRERRRVSRRRIRTARIEREFGERFRADGDSETEGALVEGGGARGWGKACSYRSI